MQVMVKPGTYVVAVSGGVDSMALLHILQNRPGLRLIVAHFDHGIRDDSHLDRKLIEQVTKTHKLPFVFAKGKLGPSASEATARTARYKFLKSVAESSGAKAIITAHHQDDLLETALLNMFRGTGRRGLTSLKNTDGIIRPLLNYPKERIKEYANTNKVAWREDSTNADVRYRRNYIRHNFMTKITPGERAQFVILLEKMAELNEQLDAVIINLLHTQPAVDVIDRQWFALLPHDVSKEVLHHWFTRHGVKDINKRRIEQLVTSLKTAKPLTTHEVSKKHKIKLTKKTAKLSKV